ncbi:hypothetical protein ACHAXR_001362 [Thalassiosira sp. AJA248-18]
MIKPGFVASPAGSSARSISGIAARHHVHHALPQLHEAISAMSASTSLPTFLTSVKIFDGSEITNAVVVSNSYWSTLSSKLPYLILAQLLASITFVVISSLVTAQGKFILDQATDSNVGNGAVTQQKAKVKKSQFRRADELPPTQLDFSKLFLCICIDILGSANEVIPLVGELVDVIYAPIAALLLRQLFAGSNIVFLLEFTEEILPFTDVLPLATICWVVESFFGSGSLARALRIGEFANIKDSGGVIDVGGSSRAKGNNEDGRGGREKLLLLQSKDDDDRDNVKR